MNTFDIFNEYDYKEDYSYLNDVIIHTFEVLDIKKANMSVIFIDDEKMHELNKEYRGVDRTTDVLSFALEDGENIKLPIRELGDVFVSIPKMIEQAKEFNHSEKRELSFLVCHGLLHLLGYDHTRSKEEEEKQFGLQDKILGDLNIID
ncbi:MAG: rRNA maturation RNase YbeY [Bacilli bacterium]|nr:rRNA maturation RNase YbeY [Bacilli bacterium]